MNTFDVNFPGSEKPRTQKMSYVTNADGNMVADDEDKDADDEDIPKATQNIEAESSQQEASPKMPCQEIVGINVEPLKKELESKEAKILELTRHIHMLETDPPAKNKKRRLGDVGNDEMHAAMVDDSANKDIIIAQLTKENEVLKVEASKAKADEKVRENEIQSLTKDVQDKERQVSDLQKKNDTLSFKQIELDRLLKDDRSKHQGQSKYAQQKNNDIKLLKQQVQTLTEKLENREAELEDALKTLNENDWNEKSHEKESGSSELLTEMQKMIDIKFRNMESTVSNIVEKKLEEKQIGAGNKTYAQAVDADLAKHESTTNGQLVENLRNVIRESKNEEISEEKEKKKRERNVIIHGTEINTEIQEPTEYVNDLIKVLSIGAVKPKSVKQIGNTEKRPLHVEFFNTTDKSKFMRNLKYLKDKPEYKRVSITDDYTINERNLIRQVGEEVKEKNSQEDPAVNFVWRVRGSSKNGFRPTKVPKKVFQRSQQDTAIEMDTQA